VLPGGDPLLAARVAVPPVPATFVDRQRLADRLSDGLRYPLVLVNGPAGAGKTLLVARWAATATLPGPLAWLTAEREDNAPGVFWAYLLEALRRGGAELPEDIGAPVRPDSVDHSLLTRLAAHLGGRTTPAVVVLDEFERITAPAVAQELDRLLRHAAGGMRLVLISRTEPLLPLHRYRAAGGIAEIRAAAMAFTPDETAVLLRRHGLCVSDQGVRALTDRTEGWAAGLRLCALAAEAAADPDAYLKEFEAGDNTVADFLLAEVLEAQPAETQDLLLSAGILERIHPGLADALTGRRDAAGILEHLTRANAFVTPLGHGWYRLHPLFAEILRVNLRARRPGAEEELHRRAAHWLHAHGRVADALPHATAAGDWGTAASWFVDDLAVGQLFHGLAADRWAALLADLPPGASGPAVELVRAARQIRAGEAARALRHLDRADRPAADGGDPRARELTSAFLRVLAAGAAGLPQMAEAASRTAEALERALPADRLARRPELPALRLNALGSARLWAGRTAAAEDALAAAVRAAEGRALAAVRHEALGRLALIALTGGAPGPAEALAGEAVAAAEHGGLPPTATAMGRLVLAGAALDRDDLAAARDGLARVAAATGARSDPLAVVALAVLRSRLLLARGGDPRAALRVLADAQAAVRTTGPSPWAEVRIAEARGAALLAAGDPRAALAALHAVPPGGGPVREVALAGAELACGDAGAALARLDALPPAAPDAVALAVRALLVRAEAVAALGDLAAARRSVDAALRAAAPQRLRLPFRTCGPRLRGLVQERPAAPGRAPRPARPETLPAGPSASAPPVVVESLSARERDVLERVAQLMSTDEVAADLHLSVNTVKTHLKNINRKLGARRRGEAVRRARELHLL
jgi:LuxR family maltose regulon positive regulatory protein